MKTLLISFYSDIEDKTYYSDNANRLREECKSLDIQCSIQHKESLGSYQLNQASNAPTKPIKPIHKSPTKPIKPIHLCPRPPRS